MVKGISRQVIVVHSPDKKHFDQAIFILKEGQNGVSDDALLKEATELIRSPDRREGSAPRFAGPLWACGGALFTAVLWLLSTIF